MNAVAKMRRDGLTLPQAARAVGIQPRLMIPLVRPALRKQRNGRWTVTQRDSLLRPLSIPGTRGTREIAVNDSRTATVISDYLRAVRPSVDTGNAALLKPFRKLKLLDANGKRISLVTNARALERLAEAGVLSFEDMYLRTAR